MSSKVMEVLGIRHCSTNWVGKQNGQDSGLPRTVGAAPGTDVEQGMPIPEEPTADKHLEGFFKEVTVIKACFAWVIAVYQIGWVLLLFFHCGLVLK